MGDEPHDISSVLRNLVPIPSEFEGMSDDTSDVPNCDTNRVNVESDFVESLINRDTSIIYSSKIDPILEEFAGELAHIAPILPGIEIDSLEEENDVDQEEKEFDLEDILQIQDVILREKLLNISRLITNIESLKDNPIPVADSAVSEEGANEKWLDYPDFEDSRTHGFVHLFELHILSFI
ncbi:hypothetical protein Tco_0988152 [Tanacetum coccineum]|uniref:Uncharacterized protein n=1 Tax=Tanacetum coccineum TaxID=301880 RepID=A0ABQ5EQ65_9ASTR